ncbi:phospholipase A1 isoform X1 [Aethina tumida]|uniref:phospholipase A1 isoform X1 n=1 Tax=Aethina tumida TaxID=116153 RepID=UPI00214857B5|nr:phospholipase A1 isoform X1 [Aethina tumida]
MSPRLLLYFTAFIVFLTDVYQAKIVYNQEFYLTLPPVDYDLANATKSDVFYRLFVNTTDQGTYLTEDNLDDITLNTELPTVLLIHGWTTDDTSPWYAPLKDAFFKKGSYNVLYVNWNKAGNLSYDVSCANTKPVGLYMAEFLIKSKIQPEKIHLIGHSLGSHLTSWIGKYYFKLTSNKIGRITALDPAGPKFQNPLMTPDLRLCETDAEFVDVIHTDIQWYGYTLPIGDVDFYPNNGGKQPGCPSRLVDDNCSHARSTLYFIESVLTEVVAKECNVTVSGFEVDVKEIAEGQKTLFGLNVDQKSRGSFVFTTNSESPFLINDVSVN